MSDSSNRKTSASKTENVGAIPALLAMDSKDFFAQMKETENYYKKHFVQEFFRNIYHWIFWGIPRVVNDCRYEVKWAFQRAFRGYDDNAKWDLARYITDIALPMLKYLKNNKSGIPILDTVGASFEKQEKEWDRILDCMINSFQLLKNEDEDFEIHDKRWYQENEKQIQEGLQLFAKHYRSLWD